MHTSRGWALGGHCVGCWSHAHATMWQRKTPRLREVKWLEIGCEVDLESLRNEEGTFHLLRTLHRALPTRKAASGQPETLSGDSDRGAVRLALPEAVEQKLEGPFSWDVAKAVLTFCLFHLQILWFHEAQDWVRFVTWYSPKSSLVTSNRLKEPRTKKDGVHTHTHREREEERKELIWVISAGLESRSRVVTIFSLYSSIFSNFLQWPLVTLVIRKNNHLKQK